MLNFRSYWNPVVISSTVVGKGLELVYHFHRFTWWLKCIVKAIQGNNQGRIVDF